MTNNICIYLKLNYNRKELHICHGNQQKMLREYDVPFQIIRMLAIFRKIERKHKHIIKTVSIAYMG